LYFGELASLGAAACWAAASILFARLGNEAKIAPRTLNVFKCSLAMLLLWLTMGVLHGTWLPAPASPQALGALAASGLIGLTMGDTAYFHALMRLGPRRTLIFAILGTPVTALLAWPILGEHFTLQMAVGMSITLGGVVWVIRERTAAPLDAQGEPDETPGPLLTRSEWQGVGFAMVAVLCQAIGNVLTKLGSEGMSSVETSTTRLFFGVVALLVWMLWRKEAGALRRAVSTKRQLGMLVVATILGTYLGIWLLVTGLQYTEKAGVAATLTSLSPVFILPLARIFMKEHISARAVLGALIAVAGVVVLVFARG
jgi:drug/metabolite transporter (DMT)-like permease